MAKESLCKAGSLMRHRGFSHDIIVITLEDEIAASSHYARGLTQSLIVDSNVDFLDRGQYRNGSS